jgi:hypothetical protein
LEAEAMTPEQLSAAVSQFIADARAKATGGLTVAEFGSLVVELLRLAVSGLDAVTALDGPSKKAWSLSAVALLFDTVADACVPFPAKPVWWLVRPAVRSLVLAAAGGALEQILRLSRAATPAPEAAA